MNDKIRELAEQSGFFPVPDETEWDWEYRAENARYEKFAELIINKHLSIWEQMDNGNAVAGYVEMEDYPKAILKYFGVEE